MLFHYIIIIKKNNKLFNICMEIRTANCNEKKKIEDLIKRFVFYPLLSFPPPFCDLPTSLSLTSFFHSSSPHFLVFTKHQHQWVSTSLQDSFFLTAVSKALETGPIIVPALLLFPIHGSCIGSTGGEQ